MLSYEQHLTSHPGERTAVTLSHVECKVEQRDTVSK